MSNNNGIHTIDEDVKHFQKLCNTKQLSWEDIGDWIETLPVPSDVFKKINLMIDEDHWKDFNTITDLIISDPIISSKFIENYSKYDSDNDRENLYQKVKYLGGNGLKVFFSNLFFESPYDEQAKYYKNKSLKTAIIAGKLFKKSNYEKKIFVSQDQIFLLALIHNLGNIILMNYYPCIYVSIRFLRDINQTNLSIAEAEHSILTEIDNNISHASIAADLFKNWNYPQYYILPTKYHHQPHRFKDNRVNVIAPRLLADVILNYTANMNLKESSLKDFLKKTDYVKSIKRQLLNLINSDSLKKDYTEFFRSSFKEILENFPDLSINNLDEKILIDLLNDMLIKKMYEKYEIKYFTNRNNENLDFKNILDNVNLLSESDKLSEFIKNIFDDSIEHFSSIKFKDDTNPNLDIDKEALENAVRFFIKEKYFEICIENIFILDKKEKPGSKDNKTKKEDDKTKKFELESSKIQEFIKDVKKNNNPLVDIIKEVIAKVNEQAESIIERIARKLLSNISVSKLLTRSEIDIDFFVDKLDKNKLAGKIINQSLNELESQTEILFISNILAKNLNLDYCCLDPQTFFDRIIESELSKNNKEHIGEIDTKEFLKKHFDEKYIFDENFKKDVLSELKKLKNIN